VSCSGEKICDNKRRVEAARGGGSKKASGSDHCPSEEAKSYASVEKEKSNSKRPGGAFLHGKMQGKLQIAGM